MDHIACELTEFEAGIVGFVVVVIARSQVQPVGSQPLALPFRRDDTDHPSCPLAVEIRGFDPHSKADVFTDAALVDDAVEIFEDRGPIGDTLLVFPRFKDEAERVHVAVGTHAGIAEQIPRPAQVLAPLDNGVAFAPAMLFEVGGHSDAGNARADDQHIEIAVFRIHHKLSNPRPNLRSVSQPILLPLA